MTDKQRIIRLQGALKEAQRALRPMVKGTCWMGGSDIRRAQRALDRIDRTLQVPPKFHVHNKEK